MGRVIAIHRFFSKELKDLKRTIHGPWLREGHDFNVTKDGLDRRGSIQSTRDSISFMDLIAILKLVDIELKGRNFIWSNRRLKPDLVRLDHFLLSDD